MGPLPPALCCEPGLSTLWVSVIRARVSGQLIFVFGLFDPRVSGTLPASETPTTRSGRKPGHSSSHNYGRCYFSNRFCLFQPIRFKHSPFFQALYRIMNHSLSAAVLPCGGSSFRVRARAKKSPSRSVPLEGAARLVETPVGESDAGKAS